MKITKQRKKIFVETYRRCQVNFVNDLTEWGEALLQVFIQITMTKKEILQKIADCFDKEKGNKARNSMGVSESFYNPYYLTGKCFSTEELSAMSELELNNLIKLADYASDAFY